MTHRFQSLLSTTAVIAVVVAAVALLAPRAQGDYAVLRSGARLHITGYQRLGDSVHLTVEGGEVVIAASDLESIEPEETFPASANPSIPGREPYAGLILAAAQKYGLDEKLLARVIAVESNFNPEAVSRKRALGLMQLLPETASRYSVSNVFDPAENIEGGARYLRDLLDRYHGNLKLALAAYNAGPETVERYGGLPPFAETQNYVRKIASGLSADSLQATRH